MLSLQIFVPITLDISSKALRRKGAIDSNTGEHRHEAPVAILIELARRGNGFSVSQAHKSVAGPTHVAPETPQKLHIFGYEKIGAITVDRGEVSPPAEHDTGIDTQDPCREGHRSH